MTGVRFVPPLHPSRPSIAVATFAALLCACAAAPRPPAGAPLPPLPRAPVTAPLAADPLRAGPSVISMPVEVDLAEVAIAAAGALPRPLARVGWRLPLPPRRRWLQASVAQDPGSCSVTGLDCLARQSVLTVASPEPAGVAAEFLQDWRLRGLQLVMAGARLQLLAQLEAVTRCELPAGSAAVAGCGGGERVARLEWRQALYPAWGPGGDLALGVGPSTWLGRAPGAPAAAGALPAELAERLAGAVATQLRARLGRASLGGRLAQAWPELNAPRQLRPGIWLLPRPGRVQLAPLAGSGGVLRTALQVEAWPELRQGERPLAPPPPPPLPLPGDGPAAGLRLALRGDLGVAAAQARLAARLRPALRYVNGRPVRLRAVRLWGQGGEAVLALSFAQPALSEVYLVARPFYDVRRNEVGFAGLAFVADSRRYLARAAPWLDHGSLLSALAAEARLGFDPALAGAMRGVRELNEAAGRGLALHGGLRQVRPQALYFAGDRLVALVLLEGRLALEATRR